MCGGGGRVSALGASGPPGGTRHTDEVAACGIVGTCWGQFVQVPTAVTSWLSPAVIWCPEERSCSQSELQGHKSADSSLIL